MTFDKAKKFKIPWGDYKGQAIDDVASTDNGLRDLDKLFGWMQEKKHRSAFRTALSVYLSDDSIKRELDNL